jgi:hypothetical protein
MLAEELFGFKRNLRTRKAIYELNNKTVRGLNDILYVLSIFCDLAKVFHCVNHDI